MNRSVVNESAAEPLDSCRRWSTMASRTRVYMDIHIGDAAAWSEENAAYARGCAFVAAEGGAYGLGAELAALDEEQAALAAELYTSNPKYSSQGRMRTTPPASLCAGRLVIELHDEVAPKAVANFAALCSGEKGVSKASGKALSYAGTPIHRIVPGFVAQGGDFVRGDGSGGESIYGKKFKDEKAGLKGKHDARGVVSMANSGRNSNTSQFFLTLAPAPQCDGKHVVFGSVVDGLDVLDAIEAVGSSTGAPTAPVVIGACGLL